ncbi:metal ABC transporter permease [Pandoraea nosoerga]|nr:metal ABC transporter permease [Pandoraea nosoerga]MBN4664180.1 metal ABC transporter permease [Pandoraea nosoerga]MBN4675411.1 metal ABC transporter permease [Pandoraea nosoerga]MBN4679267.1 metal ABC transporter permease [Pandoraea nosoerga]MBN4743735.1 metal ABC transporter permease [Pandoraea nosoerga]
MRHALVGSLALSLGCTPVGVFLLLRRMSLMGDSLSHAVLPGAAIGYLIGGLSLPWMAGGGMAAGLLVALLAGVSSRRTRLDEGASFAGFYLLALAGGVVIVSKWGNSVDLMHLLFGSVLAVDDPSLLLVAAIASVTLLWFGWHYRGLVLDSADPAFLGQGRGGSVLRYHLGFTVLTVMNLVAGFQAMGTLMAVGLMMLPAAAARLLARTLPGMLLVAWVVASASSVIGLLISYYLACPSGPAIVLTAGIAYLGALLASSGRSGTSGAPAL